MATIVLPVWLVWLIGVVLVLQVVSFVLEICLKYLGYRLDEEKLVNALMQECVAEKNKETTE